MSKNEPSEWVGGIFPAERELPEQTPGGPRWQSKRTGPQELLRMRRR